jgi:ABC-type branched-subunit amino acid transport system substrate-binding protein
MIAAAPDAVFLDAPPAQAGRLLAALRAAAPDLPVAGASVLLDPRVAGRAGAAYRHLWVHAALAADAPPLAAFAARFAGAYGQKPGVAALEGYVAVGMVAAAWPTGGGPLAEALRGLVAGPDTVLLDTVWDEAGAPLHVAFIAEVAAPDEARWLTLSRG